MTKRPTYYFHTICLIAVFTVGNAVISAPYKNASNETFLGYLAAMAISVPLILLLSAVADMIFKTDSVGNSNILIRLLKAILIFLVSAVIIISAAKAFWDFVSFAGTEILVGTPKWIIAAVFAAIVFWTAFQRDTVLFKLSIFCFLILSVVSVLFFILSIPNFRLSNIVLLRLPDIKTLSSQTLPYLYNVFLSCIPALIYQKLILGKIKKRLALSGVLSGTVIFGICLLNSLLLFGVKAAVRADFPYAEAISTVTVGNLFTRMDGFSYFLFFFSCLLKVSVCVRLVKVLFKKGATL